MAKPLSGSRRKYSRAREESTTASGPGPMPPNQALRMTAGEKSSVTTAAGCRRSVTTSAENTSKTENPSLFSTDGIRPAEASSSVIP
jgi:hypothetical protein